MAGAARAVGRDHLLALAAKVGIKALAARRVLGEVTSATAEVEAHRTHTGCVGPASQAAVEAVGRTTARVRGAQ